MSADDTTPTEGGEELNEVDALADVLFRIQHGRALSDQFESSPDHATYRARAETVLTAGYVPADRLAAVQAEREVQRDAVDTLRHELGYAIRTRDEWESNAEEAEARAEAAEAERDDLRDAWLAAIARAERAEADRDDARRRHWSPLTTDTAEGAR